MTRQTSRRPAGTPTGGQFAASAHAEADVSLGSDASPADERPAYQRAADEWASDTHNNPDGWLCDPEALLAIEECAYEPGATEEDLIEAYRRSWRYQRDKFAEHGRPQDAAFMVAIEREVVRRAGTRT